MKTVAVIFFAIAGAMAFDDWLGGWWWGFAGAAAGILVFRLWEWLANQVALTQHRRRMAERHERNSGSFGGLTSAAMRDIEDLVRRDMDENSTVMLEERGENDLAEELDAMQGEEEPFVIKVATRGPDLDPDAEECDAWIDVSGDMPRSYDKEEGQQSAWKESTTGEDGNIILMNGDLVMSLVVVKSPDLVRTIKDLMKCTHRHELQLETIRHLDSVDEHNARTLCASTGFDPEKLMPTPRDEANTGKRVIDLGK